MLNIHWIVQIEVMKYQLLLLNITPNSQICFTSLPVTVPVNGSSLLHISYIDAMRRTLGTSTPCYLDAQALLALHQMHLPDVAALSGL